MAETKGEFQSFGSGVRFVGGAARDRCSMPPLLG
jgi:hypothetical protein